MPMVSTFVCECGIRLNIVAEPQQPHDSTLIPCRIRLVKLGISSMGMFFRSSLSEKKGFCGPTTGSSIRLHKKGSSGCTYARTTSIRQQTADIDDSDCRFLL